VDAGLSKVAGELAATPYGAPFADAALTLLERGTPDEQRQLLQIPLRRAPSVGPRIAAIVRRWRGTAMDDHAGTLLLRGIEAAPRDPPLLAALEDDARRDAE